MVPETRHVHVARAIYGDAFGRSGFTVQTQMSYAMAEGIFLFTLLGVIAALMLVYLARRERRVYS